MLAKSRVSALVMSTIFFVGWALGDILSQINHPESWLPGSQTGLWVAQLVIIGVLIFLMSRTSLVLGLGPVGFGWGGLLRWLGCGLFMGLSYALLKRWLAPILGEDNALFVIGWPVLACLYYWLFFRRWIWQLDVEKDKLASSAARFGRNATAWFFYVGGLVVIGASMVGAYLATQKDIFMVVPMLGGICIGIAAILMGRIGDDLWDFRHMTNNLVPWLFGIGFVGIALVAIGMLIIP